jgi:hypothetical protein
MHYLIFGKFQKNINKLPSNVIVSLWDQKALLGYFANKYKYHCMKDNTCTNDYNLTNVKMYKLDDQYETNGDVIMIDPTELKEYNYHEQNIMNKTLTQIINDLQIKETTYIYLFPII